MNDGRTTDGRRIPLYTISSPITFGSGELISTPVFVALQPIKFELVAHVATESSLTPEI